MKRVIIATNNRDFAERSLRRRGHAYDTPAINWVESDADADKLIALKWRMKDTRFFSLWYTGPGLQGPSDEKLANLVEKFAFTSAREAFRWLDE